MTFLKDRMNNRMTLDELIHKLLNRVDAIILDFELMLLRWVGLIPSHILRLLIYKISGLQIGKGSRIHMWCNFFDPARIKIGQDSIIGDHAFLDGRDSLTIGNHVDIASYVMIYNSQHDVNSKDFKAEYGKVQINDYVFIGPRVIILPGVVIGKGAVVAAGAVVTRNVSPFTIVGGVPATVIGKRQNTDPGYNLGRARLFQ